jgi:uncharacterized protein (TIGR03083 family)
MAPDPRRSIAALRSSHDRLAGFVDGLDDDGLATQSMCTDWTVARVLSHLGSGAEIGLGTLEANVAGREPPGQEANPQIWDRWNAMEPREMASGFVAADRQLVAAFEALDEDQLASMQIKLPFLPDRIDVAGAVGFRLSEHALHSWDVFAAFDPDATVAPDSTELLIARLPMMVGLIGRFTPRETRPAEATAISITTSEPAGEFVLELGDDVALRPATGADTVDGELTIPAEALLRLIAGRLRPDRSSGDVEPAGALSMADLRRAFPGY